MSNEIEYNDVPPKAVDIPTDANVTAMRDDAIKKLEKTQIDKQVRAEAGIIEIPKEPEAIPKELPKYLFNMGSKVIKCDKFNVTDDEAKILAKHLSILTGAVNSKLFSLIIIIIVVLSKVAECYDAISRKFSKTKKTEEIKRPDEIYEETKKAEVTG